MYNDFNRQYEITANVDELPGIDDEFGACLDDVSDNEDGTFKLTYIIRYESDYSMDRFEQLLNENYDIVSYNIFENEPE